MGFCAVTGRLHPWKVTVAADTEPSYTGTLPGGTRKRHFFFLVKGTQAEFTGDLGKKLQHEKYFKLSGLSERQPIDHKTGFAIKS